MLLIPLCPNIAYWLCIEGVISCDADPAAFLFSSLESILPGRMSSLHPCRVFFRFVNHFLPRSPERLISCPSGNNCILDMTTLKLIVSYWNGVNATGFRNEMYDFILLKIDLTSLGAL